MEFRHAVTCHLVTIVAFAQSSTPPITFTFPLQGLTSGTAPINSIFDHAMDPAHPYKADGVVQSYTGEIGLLALGVNSANCYAGASKTQFVVNGNYTGAACGGKAYLAYDGHSGYDFAAHSSVVVAAADGVVVVAQPDSYADGTGRGCQCYGNYIVISHNKGAYQTLYGHLKYNSFSKALLNTSVTAGAPIAITDNSGESYGEHLHFEVQQKVSGHYFAIDPYGWQGAGQDPYAIATVALWAPQTSIRTFDLEDQIPTFVTPPTPQQFPPGALNTLTMNRPGLSVTITRESGADFDLVSNGGNQAGKPPSWGLVSLFSAHPFGGNQAYIIDTSVPVRSFSVELGNYGAVANWAIVAYSGMGGTGSVLAATSGTYSPAGFPNVSTASVSVATDSIRSVKYLAGPPNAPAAAIADNLRFTLGPSTSYDAAQDFSISHNPNGAWTYGSTSAIGGVFTPFNVSDVNIAGFTGLNEWSFGGATCAAACPPGYLVAPFVVGMPDGMSISPNIFGAAFSSSVLMMHPAVVYHPPFNQSVVRWTAPATARYSIVGQFVNGDILVGARTSVKILRNASTVFSGTINGIGSAAPFSLTAQALNAGDTIDFVVADNGNGFSHDSTGLMATITAQ